MSTKIEQPSTANASVASSGVKISMFAAKKGFVIPKNKLSGSLVPIVRGGKKGGACDAVDEESITKVQRKTKWGPDLTQDASVRKSRALAYQTRVDQITEQLKSGFLDLEGNQESQVATQNSDLESSIHQKSELLELERREAIGEILKLNPSYKAPSDYKPLLKEAKVPVPVKEYPGYNFIGLLFGPSNDTQKRLEKETGAKVRVYGTKATTREKMEVSFEASEAPIPYEELYVHISADTYEKVDSAVTLIELLLKPVLVNQSTVTTTPTSVSGDNVSIVDQTQSTTAPYMVTPLGVNGELPQSFTGPAQNPLQAQLNSYPGPGPGPGPWFSQGPSQAHINPPIGFNIPPNHSTQLPSTSIPPNMTSLFGPRPVPQRPFISQGHFGPSQSISQPGLSNLTPYNNINQPSPAGFSPVGMPPGPSTSQPMGPVTFSNVLPPRMQQGIVHPATQNQIPSTLPPVLQTRTPNSFQGNAPSFTPIQQSHSINAQKLHHSNSDNFTFQPRGPPNLASQGGHRPMNQNMPGLQQNPSFRPPIHNSSPQPNFENMVRPQMNQFRNQRPFHENLNLGPQVGPRNLFPVPPNSRFFQGEHQNFGNPFPPRYGNSFHLQQNFHPTNRPQEFFSPNIQRGGNASNISMRPSSVHGAQQVYDPFSPSAASTGPPRVGNSRKLRKQESDPEYEDLMASVGVK